MGSFRPLLLSSLGRMGFNGFCHKTPSKNRAAFVKLKMMILLQPFKKKYLKARGWKLNKNGFLALDPT